MAVVYISYARGDSRVVKHVADAIAGSPHGVLVDDVRFPDPAQWSTAMGHVRASDLFLLALSDALCDSDLWTAELEYAAALGKPIVYVVVGPGSDRVALPPDVAAPVHALKRWRPDWQEHLLRFVDEHVEMGRGLPDPPPDEPPPPTRGDHSVPRRQVRDIESKTMSKLRHPARSQVLRDYLDGEPPLLASPPVADDIGVDSGSGMVDAVVVGSADDVASSVFAPPTVETGATFMVQVFLHRPEHFEDVRAEASSYDDAAGARGSSGLTERLAAGDRVAVELVLPTGFVVDESVQGVVWSGAGVRAVQFLVDVAPDQKQGATFGTVLISRELVPIGRVKFKLTVGSVGDDSAPTTPAFAGQMQAYRRAFISYASTDRTKVLKHAQLLDGVGIDYFQDVLAIKSGERWQRTLFDEIDRCDLFLLFWSAAARDSDWVTTEWRRALARQAGDEDAPPAIVPVDLGDTPRVPPPPELNHLHFGGRMAYFAEPPRHSKLAKMWRAKR